MVHSTKKPTRRRRRESQSPSRKEEENVNGKRHCSYPEKFPVGKVHLYVRVHVSELKERVVDWRGEVREKLRMGSERVRERGREGGEGAEGKRKGAGREGR